MSKFIFCTFFYLMLSVIGVAQQGRNIFYITGKVKVEQGIVDNTKIQIFRDGGLLNTIEVNNTGSFRVGVDLNHVYRFVIWKEGMYAKTVEVDSHVPKDVCNEDCKFPPYQLSVLLYKTVPGVKEANTQIGRISYNPKVDNFDAEMLRESSTESTETAKAIDEIRKQSQQYEQQAANAKNTKYKNMVAEADQLFANKEYEKAMQLYRDAYLIFPEVVYPRTKVNQLYQLIVADQLSNSFGPASVDNFLKYLNYGDKKYEEREYSMAKIAYEKAQQIKPDDEIVKNKLFKANLEVLNINDLAISEVNHRKTIYNTRIIKYNDLIKQGDKKFLNGEFAEAKDFYAEAAMLIDENSYSLLMIKKIDELLGSDEAALKFAKEREEAEKKRLREARNIAYNDAIVEADRLYSERLYRDAQENYELAVTIKEFEPYPQQQLRLIKTILAQMQLRGEEYNNLLREAETLFIEKEYLKAREAYNKAHLLIPDEKFALSKIKAIDDILLKLNDEEKNNNQYNQFFHTAEDLTTQKKYSEAITAYQEASKLKPSEELPKTRIKEIREILSRENDAQKREMQKQNDYDKFIAMADEAYLQLAYKSARSFYQEALGIMPSQTYPTSQINKIDALLKEKENASKGKSKLDQIDFSNLENISSDFRKEAYEEAMQLGNSFSATEEWGLSRFYFRRALALYPTDNEATQKLAFVDGKIRGGNINETKYNELIAKAEEAFRSSDFSVAKFYYTKAKEIKPDNEELNERIKIVTKLAGTTAVRNANDEFNSTMNKGNEAFTNKNYSVARFFYRKALSLRPSDEQAKAKLAQVESQIGK